MSFNGSGVWTANSTGLPVVTGTVISSTMFNALTSDLATGLTTTVCKDGQQTCTALVPFAQGISIFGQGTIGTWTQVSFTAGDFTGGGAQTWTLASGDLIAFEYTLINKLMVVSFVTATTTTNGGDASLFIKIPGSKSANKPASGVINYIDNGGTPAMGKCVVYPSLYGATLIACQKGDSSAWSASTNATNVSGQIVFETT